MCNILLISHSHELAKANYDFVNEMKQKDFKLDYVGGLEDGKEFGTNPMTIFAKLDELIKTNSGVLIIYDLGSSLLNAKSAIEMFEAEESKNKIAYADVAFVEGALAAVCSNNEEMTPTQLKQIIEQQCKVTK